MQPEMKCPMSIAEAESLADWLENVAGLYDTDARISAQEAIDAQTDRKREELQFAAKRYRTNAAEAREWARVVKPVPVKRRG